MPVGKKKGGNFTSQGTINVGAKPISEEYFSKKEGKKKVWKGQKGSYTFRAGEDIHLSEGDFITIKVSDAARNEKGYEKYVSVGFVQKG